MVGENLEFINLVDAANVLNYTKDRMYQLARDPEFVEKVRVFRFKKGEFKFHKSDFVNFIKENMLAYKERINPAFNLYSKRRQRA